MKRLNVKLVLYLAVASLVLLVAVYFVHGLQIERTAKMLLREAASAASEGKFRQAATHYQSYVAYKPEDTNARAEFALTLSRLADQPSPNPKDVAMAFSTLNDVLTKDAERADVRWRLAILLANHAGRSVSEIDEQVKEVLRALTINKSPDNERAYLTQYFMTVARVLRQERIVDLAVLERASAKDQSKIDETSKKIQQLTEVQNSVAGLDTAGLKTKLAELQPQIDQTLANLELLHARCQANLGREVGTVQEEGAVEILNRLVARDPKQIDAFRMLASIYRDRLSQAEKADEVMDRMVSSNEQSANDLKARTYVARALYLRSRGGTPELLDRANGDIQQALSLNGKSSEVLLAAAEVAVARKEFDAARQYLDEGKRLDPSNTAILNAISSVDLQRGNTQQAETSIENSLKVDPRNEEAILNKVTLDLQQGKLNDVRATVKDLEEQMQRRRLSIISRPMLEYIKALVLVVDSKWLEASETLEQIRPLLPGYADQIDLRLGQCYGQLGQPDRQREAYERVTQRNPNSLPARLGQASALAAMGRAEEALSLYRRIRDAMGVEEAVKNPLLTQNLVSLILAQTAKLPEDQRDWTEIETLLAAWEKQSPDVPQVVLSRCELLARKGDLKSARAFLQAALDKKPDESAWWLGAASLAERDEGKDAAQGVLDRAQKQLGDSSAIRSAQIALASGIGGEEGSRKILSLAQGIEKFPPAEQDAVLRTAGRALIQLRDLERAIPMFRKIAEHHPEDPQNFMLLFDLARETGDERAIQSALDDVKKQFGAESAYWMFGEAARLAGRVRQNQGDRSEQLRNARQLAERAANLRPKWSSSFALAAELDDLEGKPDDAIRNLKQAVDLGQRNPTLVARLIDLLMGRGRWDEAGQYFKYLEARPGMSLVESQNELGKGNLPRAIELAQKALSDNPEDPNTNRWLGQLMARDGNLEEAEKLFRKAVAKGNSAAQNWLVLVSFLVENKKLAEAQAVIREVEVSLPEDQLPLVLAQCYEIAGDSTQAERYYLMARDAKPDDLTLTRVLATFYLRARATALAAMAQDPQAQAAFAEVSRKARQELEKIVQGPPAQGETGKDAVSWARREVARMTASSGKYEDLLRALTIIDQNAQGGKLSDDDRALRADMLSARPDLASRKQAVTDLEAISDQGKLSPDSRLALARLYESVGDWTKCRSEMVDLLADQPQNANFVAAYVQMLLRRGAAELGSVDPWVAKLEQLQPKAPLTVGLKARVLVDRGKTEEAEALVKTLLPKPIPSPLPKAAASDIATVAGMLEGLGQNKAAEDVLTDLVGRDPRYVLALASFQGRHGKLSTALDMCDEARKVDHNPTEAAAIVVSILRAQQKVATAADFQRAEAWLMAAGAAAPDSPAVQNLQAELYELQGPSKTKEVEQAYRQLLNNPKAAARQRAVAQNNLAFILAIRGEKGNEALNMIEDAIKTLGPASELLDTRGMVYLARGEAKQAITDLEQSLSDGGPSGVKLFHLAQAYHAGSDRKNATATFERAVDEFKLNPDSIHPAEIERLQNLSAALGIKLSLN